MTTPLRVLIAEDSADDVALVIRALSDGGYDVAHENVQDERSFSAAIGRTQWDLVISDFRMPVFTGLDALAITRRLRPDTPFIIVSGTIGEEIAVDTLKAGANDYVMKDRLGRLVPAVRRELDRKADQSRLREKDEQFRQAQRMEAVGRLAGGIAHDFNNVLAVIVMYCDMMLSRLSAEDYIARDVEQIRAAADRAAALTRQLLAFSRKQVLAPRVLDLNPIISNLEKMLRRLIGEDVKLKAVLADGLPRIRIDPGQLEQVIMNLVVNSRDAMPNGGHLTVETANETVAPGSPLSAAVPPGAYVRLSVADTGTGMDAKTRASLFEPFFTTKEAGRGTGLGLATVHGIVSQSGGYITVDTELGRGTVFHIHLPANDAMPEPDAIAAGEAPAPNLSLAGRTVLVVEDEATFRSVLSRTLERLGLKVIEASSPEEAEARIAGARIDLLVSDVRLPGSSGLDLAAELVRRSPGLAVVMMSGYLDDEVSSRPGILERTAFLQKPFSMAQLTHRVAEALRGQVRNG